MGVSDRIFILIHLIFYYQGNLLLSRKINEIFFISYFCLTKMTCHYNKYAILCNSFIQSFLYIKFTTMLPPLPANHCISLRFTYNMSVIGWLNVLIMMIKTTRHMNYLLRNISKLTVIINLILW
jgi:hypothetical protein